MEPENTQEGPKTPPPSGLFTGSFPSMVFPSSPQSKPSTPWPNPTRSQPETSMDWTPNPGSSAFFPRTSTTNEGLFSEARSVSQHLPGSTYMEYNLMPRSVPGTPPRPQLGSHLLLPPGSPSHNFYPPQPVGTPSFSPIKV